MKQKQLANDLRPTFAVVFEPGEEVIAGLRRFASEQNLTAASLTAIGALERAKIGWFDVERREYHHIPVDEQVEVLSLIGNVADDEGTPKVHAHVVLGKKDGSAIGGHLLEAYVRPTLEVIVEESPAHLRRTHDESTGLAMISLEEPVASAT